MIETLVYYELSSLGSYKDGKLLVINPYKSTYSSETFVMWTLGLVHSTQGRFISLHVVTTYFVNYPQIFPLKIIIEKASQARKSMSYNNNWLVRWLVPSFLYLSNLPVCLRIQFPEGQRAPKSARKRDIATT